MPSSKPPVTARPDWERANPAFPPDQENIHEPRDEPHWTESFHGSGYDPVNRVGLFAHLARAQFDPELWDETFVAFLPDGRMLAVRDFGYGDEPSGPIGERPALSAAAAVRKLGAQLPRRSEAGHPRRA